MILLSIALKSAINYLLSLILDVISPFKLEEVVVDILQKSEMKVKC